MFKSNVKNSSTIAEIQVFSRIQARSGKPDIWPIYMSHQKYSAISRHVLSNWHFVCYLYYS